MSPLSTLAATTLLLCGLPCTAGPHEVPDTTAMPDERPVLLYVMDPLCGWCYAFGHELDTVLAQMADSIDVQLVLGGMVTGDREGPMGDMAGYILGAIPRLESYTGVRIGEPYKDQLRLGTRWSSSVPPSLAIAAFRTLAPERTVDFAHDVQHAYFREGLDLNDKALYPTLAARLGVEGSALVRAMADPAAKLAFEADMRRSADLGVQGFPAVFVVHKGSTRPVSSGYRSAADLRAAVRAALQVR